MGGQRLLLQQFKMPMKLFFFLVPTITDQRYNSEHAHFRIKTEVSRKNINVSAEFSFTDVIKQ